MADDPVSLDEHRGMAAQKATDIRRSLSSKAEADQTALRSRQRELERALAAAPAATWPEAAEGARYLISLLAETPAAQDRQYQRLIVRVLEDLDRLSRETKSSGVPS